jgi:adenylosuccinate synthase
LFTPCRLSTPTDDHSALDAHSLGAQWGDEGKGKLSDILAAEADLCCRSAGGNNAGHTIVVRDEATGQKTSYAFHTLPSGLINPKCIAFIGSGLVINIPSMFEELDNIESQGEPPRCHSILA